MAEQHSGQKRAAAAATAEPESATTSMAKRRMLPPTVREILSNDITRLAAEHWPIGGTRGAYNAEVVERIYRTELEQHGFAAQRLMMLEFSQYLENYLWPYFDDSVSDAHVLSIMLMVNEKAREGVSPWSCFHDDEKKFARLWNRVLSLRERDLSLVERNFFLTFLINAFHSLEDPLLLKAPKIEKTWKHLLRLEKKGGESAPTDRDRYFMANLLDDLLAVLASITSDKAPAAAVALVERALEFLIDLITQLPTRRFFLAVLEDKHVTVRCRLAPLSSLVSGRRFRQLTDMLHYYEDFEINSATGLALTADEVMERSYDKITTLQRIAFKHFPELKDLALMHVAAVDTRKGLQPHLAALSDSRLAELAARLSLLPADCAEPRRFVEEVLLSYLERRPSQLQAIAALPLFPTEEDMWNEALQPTEHYTGESVLPLPKINLQFLTLHDYLLRSFTLYRLESTYEIREDIVQAVQRLQPRLSRQQETLMTGWSRMAVTLAKFEIKDVAKPNVGEFKPARVLAEATYSLATQRPEAKIEWDSLRLHDAVFLVTVEARLREGERPDPGAPLHEQLGVLCVRGGEVAALLDERGQVLREESDRRAVPGHMRTVRVLLDTAQYQRDAEAGRVGLYERFNVLVRRKPKENNFKAVLETIRDLMSARATLPPWLHDLFLGYGDPASAHHSRLLREPATVDYRDTFLSAEHVRAAFPGREIVFRTQGPDEPRPPFRLTIPAGASEPVVVEPYTPASPGPYPVDQPRRNAIPFTASQVDAIRSGVSPGLTMVVGPPGTGKTDVAVQIINLLYHNHPKERILIVTHSNQALNQLFDKLVLLDIDERHLLRLGHGEEALETTKDFSRRGRVNYVLERRMLLLAEVTRLAQSLGQTGDEGSTCELAAHFYVYHVRTRWDAFKTAAAEPKNQTADFVREQFPFRAFFANVPNLFTGSFAADLAAAEGCMRHLQRMFEELDDCRAFELLRNVVDRGDYLLTRQARIVAMTCTHAAIKRRDLLEMRFHYDSVVMEEAGQILDVETCIPLLLQPMESENKLKRLVLIGDHNQLPPIVQNMALQKYSHLDQSLFARFIRLTAPHVQLDAQGRCRPSIAALFNWRYKNLRDLPNVTLGAYQLANAGFAYPFQLIDVGDLDGRGESTPLPFFYQNLAEAEYIVATYMYMRLLGYPADRISILSTYNGQKQLIRDVLNRRCGAVPFFGRPHKITTVDRYQGQQNDYILLSLVRTKAVGHIRDVRRLVVALSRARLGLYIFARVRLFENCYELSPAFAQLLQRPTELTLVPAELYPATRTEHETPAAALAVRDVHHMLAVVRQVAEQATALAAAQVQAMRAQMMQPIAPAEGSTDAAPAEAPAAAEQTAAEQTAAAPSDRADGDAMQD